MAASALTISPVNLMDMDVEMSSPILSPINYVTPPENRSPVDVVDHEGQEPGEDSDSEVEQEVTADSKVSDRRKAQNAVFED